jgi:hypothetical protein
MKNPTAFPLNYDSFESGKPPMLNNQGMLMLDYFAAKALPTILAESNYTFVDPEVAHLAYKVASNMLAEREKYFKSE